METPGITALFKMVMDERTGTMSAQVTLMTVYGGRTLSKSFEVSNEVLSAEMMDSVMTMMKTVKQAHAMEMFGETYHAMQVAMRMGEMTNVG